MIYVAQLTVEHCLYMYVFRKCTYGRLCRTHIAVAKTPKDRIRQDGCVLFWFFLG